MVLDETGGVRAEFAEDDVAKGDRGRGADQIERDRADVFANLVPEA